jgi:hypothetical protein
VKPHQLGGAYNERCIALWEPRGVRLVTHIDAEHYEYRYFFAHLETSRRERLRATATSKRTVRHSEHIKNITLLQHIFADAENFPALRENRAITPV